MLDIVLSMLKIFIYSAINFTMRQLLPLVTQGETISEELSVREEVEFWHS